MPIDFETLDLAINGPKVPVAESPDSISPQPDSEFSPQDCDEHGNPAESTKLPPIVDAFSFTIIEIPEPIQIIQHLAHQGTKMILGGGSKSYKTWLQLDLAISLAYGLDWLGHSCTAGRVLYINLEIPDVFFQKRVLKLCSERGITQVEGRLDVWNLRGYAADYKSLLPLIIHRIKEAGYIAVFIDPVYKIYGKTDENSASEVAQMLNGIERVCVDTKAMVAFGAHYSKGNQSGKEAIDRISGSGAFARDPESIINFTPHEDDKAFVVETILRNLPPVDPFVVRWGFPIMRRDDDADPTRLKLAAGRPKGHDPLDLLAHLKDHPGSNPISLRKWADKAGISHSTLSPYLEAMRGRGWIMTLGEGSKSAKAITEIGLAALESAGK